MYSVSSELYLEVAARLAEAIGGRSYFSGSLTFPFGDMECRLTASVIVYRRRERLPEATGTRCGPGSRLVGVSPSAGDGEALNDFSFSEVRAPSDLLRRSSPPSPARRCRRAHPDKKPARRGAAHGFFKKFQ